MKLETLEKKFVEAEYEYRTIKNKIEKKREEQLKEIKVGDFIAFEWSQDGESCDIEVARFIGRCKYSSHLDVGYNNFYWEVPEGQFIRMATRQEMIDRIDGKEIKV